MMDITPAQLDNMRHALGLNQPSDSVLGNAPFRNFFWTDRDSPDGQTWEPLVDAGLAWRSAPQKGYGGMVMYAVTDAGLAALHITNLSRLEPRERFVGNFSATEIIDEVKA